MAGEDGYVRIGTKIDDKGLDDGLGKIDKKLNAGTKGTASFASGLAKAGVAAAAAAAAVKVAINVVNDLTDTYRTQAKAEIQLESAAKNNPYLDDAAVAALKDYASELQRVAAVGDESLLPYMAQLATAGRTQAQIQEIMQVALDASASGAMSLDSAVRNLNKTYGGLAGELGETVPELRALTKEQMQQGAAVKLLGQRYKGMAAEVANATGSSDKLKNAFGDLKETLGRPFEEAIGPVRTYFATLIQGWADARKARRDYDKAAKDALASESVSASAFIDQWEKSYGKKAQKKARDMFAILGPALSDAGSSAEKVRAVFARITEQTGMTTEKIIALNDKYKIFEDYTNKAIDAMRADVAAKQAVEDAARKAADAEAARLAKLKQAQADAAARDAAAAEHIAKVTDAREKAIKQIELQAAAEGREVEQLDVINAYVSSYVSLIGESNGLVTENNVKAKELLATIQAMAAAHDAVTKAEQHEVEAVEKLKDELRGALDAIKEDVSGSAAMRDQLEVLDELQAQAISNEKITAEEKLAIQEEYAEKRKILLDQIEKAEADEAAAEVAERKAKNIEKLEIANTFAQQYQQIMADIQALVSQQIEDEEAVKTAELQKQYESGAISAEEYEEKLTEIKREAAKEKYKIDMWAWSANLAAAIANTALAATKALADGGGWLGAELAAAVIAAGGVQLASLIKAKPIPPAFATGGIVPGSSYTGDKVVSRLNSGEMVWNAAQQRALWNKVSSGDWGASGARVQVFNSASNVVRADTKIDDSGIRIAIRQVVSKDMADGRFNAPMRKAQQNMRGTRYTS